METQEEDKLYSKSDMEQLLKLLKKGHIVVSI